MGTIKDVLEQEERLLWTRVSRFVLTSEALTHSNYYAASSSHHLKLLFITHSQLTTQPVKQIVTLI